MADLTNSAPTEQTDATDETGHGDPGGATAPTDGARHAAALAELDALVPEWLSVPEAAELQGVSLSDVRAQLKERRLVGVRRGQNKAVSIPAVFVTSEGPRPEIRGTVTVLSDGGMRDVELLRWLFTPDDTLPVAGSPMDCILAGHKTEIRRRAMETAF